MRGFAKTYEAPSFAREERNLIKLKAFFDAKLPKPTLGRREVIAASASAVAANAVWALTGCGAQTTAIAPRIRPRR